LKYITKRYIIYGGEELERDSYLRYKQLQKELETDGEYLYLHEVRRSMEPEFRALMGTLTEEQAALIREYLGICGEIDQRETELACCLP